MVEQEDKLDKVIKQVFERVKNQGPKGAACPDDEVLAAYYEGNLDPEERERIEEHAAYCSKCADTLISFAEAESSYASSEESYSTHTMLKRAKALVKRKEKSARWDRIYSWLIPFRPKPALAMAFIVLVVVAYSVFRLQAPSPDLPLPAQFNLIARSHPQDLARGPSEEISEVEVQNGGVLRSGDMLKIRFTPQEDVYAYLLSVDSQGNISLLFPDQHAETLSPCKSGETYEFPEKNNWLELDENTGEEKFFLITSEGPIEKIDKKVVELRKSGVSNISEIFPGSRIQSFTFDHRQKETQ